LFGQLTISRRTIAAQKESQREIIASQQSLAGTARRHTLLDKRAEAYIDYIRELQTFPYLPDIDPTHESMKQIAEYMERLEEWLEACMDNVAPLYAYASNDLAPKVLEDQRLIENGVMWIWSRLNAILNLEVVESEPELILNPS